MAARPRFWSGFTSGLAAAFVALLPFWNVMDLAVRDWLMRKTQPAAGGHPDVALIIVTDESIEWMQRENDIAWPWDREAFAYLFNACGKGGAVAVLFDFFTLIDAGPGEEELIRTLLESSPPTWIATPFKEQEVRSAELRTDLAALLDKFAIEVESDGSVEAPDLFKSVLLPRPEIARAVAGVCDVSSSRDPDGVIRRYRLFSRFRGRHYPSFALAGLMEREKTRKVRISGGMLTVGRVSVPVERDGTVRLRYYRPGRTFKLLAASRVIGGLRELGEKGKVTTFDPKDVEGKVVFVGTDAAALFDLKATPVSGAMAGCEVHAVALANLLNGDGLRDAPRWISWALILLVAIITAVATRNGSAGISGALAAVTLGLYGAVSYELFKSGWFIGMVPQAAAIVFSFTAATTLNYLYEGRQRRRIQRDFQRYLSPRVVDKILREGGSLDLAGERKELTVFFMDFAGFTSMSENLDPSDLVKLISEYHEEAAQEIFATEGTIDKYIGDAIMAFWNDPVDQPDHAAWACLAAVRAQRRLRALAEKMRARGLPEMRARIGINTGIATVGNMGARGQVNYTVIGDEVNLASRLEGVNKEFGTEIIVSEATWRGAQDRLEGRELALLRVKGKKQPVRIYEVMGEKVGVAPERIEAARAFERGLAEYRARRWAEARALFAGGDTASKLYAALCNRFAADPPGADWDGAYQMEKK